LSAVRFLFILSFKSSEANISEEFVSSVFPTGAHELSEHRPEHPEANYEN
jgi:hypothetical protein